MIYKLGFGNIAHMLEAWHVGIDTTLRSLSLSLSLCLRNPNTINGANSPFFPHRLRHLVDNVIFSGLHSYNSSLRLQYELLITIRLLNVHYVIGMCGIPRRNGQLPAISHVLTESLLVLRSLYPNSG